MEKSPIFVKIEWTLSIFSLRLMTQASTKLSKYTIFFIDFNECQ